MQKSAPETQAVRFAVLVWLGSCPWLLRTAVFHARLMFVNRVPISVPNTKASDGRSVPAGSNRRISRMPFSRVLMGMRRSRRVFVFFHGRTSSARGAR